MVLRSHTPGGVQQEVWGFLLVHYAIRTLMHQAALDAGTGPDRISFTRTLRLVRRQVTAQAAFPPSRLARALSRALAEIQRHLLTRRARHNPRVVGCPAFSGHLNWCYFMLRAAGSDTRREPLAESGTRVRNEGESDYSGARCSEQYPPSPSSSSGKLCGGRAQLSAKH